MDRGEPQRGRHQRHDVVDAALQAGLHKTAVHELFDERGADHHDEPEHEQPRALRRVVQRAGTVLDFRRIEGVRKPLPKRPRHQPDEQHLRQHADRHAPQVDDTKRQPVIAHERARAGTLGKHVEQRELRHPQTQRAGEQEPIGLRRDVFGHVEDRHQHHLQRGRGGVRGDPTADHPREGVASARRRSVRHFVGKHPLTVGTLAERRVPGGFRHVAQPASWLGNTTRKRLRRSSRRQPFGDTNR